jgi:hypothetical protein
MTASDLLVPHSRVPNIPYQTYEYLRDRHPATLVTTPHDGVTKRYTFAPTFEVIDGMYSHGWQVTHVGGSSLHGVHLVTFRDPAAQTRRLDLGGLDVRAHYLGSHNRARRTEWTYGVLRKACTNGLMVPVAGGQMKRRHTGAPIDFAAITAQASLDAFVQIERTAEEWRGIELNTEQIERFAQRAYILRENLDPLEPLDGQQHSRAMANLRVRRILDKGNDVWSVFNRLQEGVVYRINAVGRRMDLNLDLWRLATEIAAAAKGGN